MVAAVPEERAGSWVGDGAPRLSVQAGAGQSPELWRRCGDGATMGAMKTSYDVVIIGGGVTGSATAYFLAAEDAFDGSVLVVERDPTYQDAPSARATGGIRQQFSTPENVRIGLFGAQFIRRIGEHLAVDGEAPDVAFRERGYLLLATPEALPVLRANHAVQVENGADIAFQTPDELRARFPWLATAGLAGGFLGLSNEGWLDPYALLQAFRRKARALGVAYVADEAVGLTRRGGRVTAVTLRDGGQIEAGAVVDAAGAVGAAKIAAMAGIELPVEPRRRCTFVFECREDLGVPPLTILPSGITFRPEGRSFLSNVSPPPERDPVGDALEVDHWLFEEIIWPALAEWVPAFEAIRLVNAYACLYDFNTLDENAILGRPAGLENFYVACGFSGHGLQQSPAVGRALSELIAFGRYRTLDLSRFGYERVLTGSPIVETNCW
jgi:glycine/D-amino acid oxidase-like deaminating enzyme